MDTKPDMTMPNCANWIASVGMTGHSPACQASTCCTASGLILAWIASLVTRLMTAVRYEKLEP